MKLSVSHLLSTGLPGWTSCLETGVIKICTCSCNGHVLGCHYLEDTLCVYSFVLMPWTLLCFEKFYSDIPCGIFFRGSLVVLKTGRGAWDITRDSWDLKQAVHATFGARPDITVLWHCNLPVLWHKSPLCSGHQAQSCNLSRQEGMDDENDRLGARVKVQLNLSFFASKV